MSTAVGSVSNAAVPLRRDALIVGVVACAHLVSHFFQLVLPAVFPWLRAEFGYSYAQLGFVMTVLFTASGLAQAVAGFLVDRVGALRVLLVGLAALGAGALLVAAADTYALLLLGAGVIGLGNCVFHPVDFSLINHRVSVPRLGPAYSIHGLSGSVGWALAPLFMVGLATPFGWRLALLAAATLPALTIMLALATRHVLTPEAAAVPPSPTRSADADTAFGFLRLRAIWLCFAFFVFVAAALGGVQSFAATVFSADYGLAVAAAASSVTIYMLASGVGMLAGGWLLARHGNLERNITLALALATAAAVLIGLGILPATIALGLMAVMGFGSGLSGPSRDMLIRTATPVGATGRVYGVVYSGLDAGIAVGPLIFGRMLDAGLVGEVFHAVALCVGFAIVVTWRVGAHIGARATAPRTAAQYPAGDRARAARLSR